MSTRAIATHATSHSATAGDPAVAGCPGWEERGLPDGSPHAKGGADDQRDDGADGRGAEQPDTLRQLEIPSDEADGGVDSVLQREDGESHNENEREEQCEFGGEAAGTTGGNTICGGGGHDASPESDGIGVRTFLDCSPE